MANKYAVVNNAFGSVIKLGMADFSNEYDPETQTIVIVNKSSYPIDTVPLYYHKIENDLLVEMSPEEKALIDSSGIIPPRTAIHYPDSETNPEYGKDGDCYYNTLLGLEMQYDEIRGKWLSIIGASIHGEHNGVTAVGAYFKGSDGRVMSATRGVTARYSGTITAINYTRDNSNLTTFEIVADGLSISELATNKQNDFYNYLDGDFEQGQVLALRNKANGSPTKYVSIDVEVRWRV